jgi:hypothetical protein|tara:strand:+ start:42 stop:182 length:141 start_codon:yes stop_codon:yes gene_type:complete
MLVQKMIIDAVLKILIKKFHLKTIREDIQELKNEVSELKLILKKEK